MSDRVMKDYRECSVYNVTLKWMEFCVGLSSKHVHVFIMGIWSEPMQKHCVKKEALQL